MSTSPTQRSLAHLRKLGYQCGITEHWNSFVKRRQDLFGCIDIVALGEGTITGVQTTSSDNVAARRDKILAEPRMRAWLKAGGLLVVHGWAVQGARGKRKVWTLREVPITLADFPESG